MSGICPRCNTRAYDAESTKVMGFYYHSMCFKCKQCNKDIALSTYVPKDEEVYCKSCHNSLFGPEGFRGCSTTIGVKTHSAVEGAKAGGEPVTIAGTAVTAAPATAPMAAAAAAPTPVVAAAAAPAAAPAANYPKFCSGTNT